MPGLLDLIGGALNPNTQVPVGTTEAPGLLGDQQNRTGLLAGLQAMANGQMPAGFGPTQQPAQQPAQQPKAPAPAQTPEHQRILAEFMALQARPQAQQSAMPVIPPNNSRMPMGGQNTTPMPNLFQQQRRF